MALLGKVTDTVPELGRGDSSHLYLHKQVFTVQDAVADIGHTKTFKGLHTAVAGQINDHSAKVYNQILYSFHTHQ